MAECVDLDSPSPSSPLHVAGADAAGAKLGHMCARLGAGGNPALQDAAADSASSEDVAMMERE
jgi:hypothetical protein